MRSVITRCLANAPQYQVLTQIDDDSEYANFMRRSAEKYSEALHSLTKPEPPLEFQDCPDCTSSLRSWSASCSTCCQTPSTKRHSPASLSFTTLECPWYWLSPTTLIPWPIVLSTSLSNSSATRSWLSGWRTTYTCCTSWSPLSRTWPPMCSVKTNGNNHLWLKSETNPAIYFLQFVLSIISMDSSIMQWELRRHHPNIHYKSEKVCGVCFHKKSAEKVRKLRRQNFATKCVNQ